jgi:hypothetical protein
VKVEIEPEQSVRSTSESRGVAVNTEPIRLGFRTLFGREPH